MAESLIHMQIASGYSLMHLVRGPRADYPVILSANDQRGAADLFSSDTASNERIASAFVRNLR